MESSSSYFDRETLLDLSVNIIPLGIIAFFLVLFVVVPSFGFDPWVTGVQLALLIIPFVGLAVLTYYSGKAIAKAEQQTEENKTA